MKEIDTLHGEWLARQHQQLESAAWALQVSTREVVAHVAKQKNANDKTAGFVKVKQ